MSGAPVDLTRPPVMTLPKHPETFVNRIRSIVISTPVRLGSSHMFERTARFLHASGSEARFLARTWEGSSIGSVGAAPEG